MKITKTHLIYIALFLISFGCKRTFYKYDIEIMNETCKEKGGINRFNTDVDVINCYCNDGSLHRIDSNL